MATLTAQRMKSGRWWLARAVVGGAALLIACSPGAPGPGSQGAGAGGPATGASGAASGTPIKIGVLADITGTFATQGASIRIGAEAAVATINASGGIKGRPLEIVNADPKSDPATAVQLAQQLVQQDHVDVLVGAVSSAECLGIQQLVPKLQVVYVTSTGCANEQFSQSSCNKYSFRILQVGRQLAIPFSKFIIERFGKRWAMLYQDYAFGQSQLKAFQDALATVGASVTLPIAFPLDEPNISPYVAKIPTDGSIDGVITGFGGADALRAAAALQQFGVSQKMPVVGVQDRAATGGTYPPALNGGLGYFYHPSDPIPGNANSKAFDDAFKAAAAKIPDVANIIGGADKAAGSGGYVAWTAVTALKLAMVEADFKNRQDTEKLITALENVKAPAGPEFPAGPFIMNKNDHQGAVQLYIYKINGQNEEILATIPVEQIPPIGTCKVS